MAQDEAQSRDVLCGISENIDLDGGREGGSKAKREPESQAVGEIKAAEMKCPVLLISTVECGEAAADTRGGRGADSAAAPSLVPGLAPAAVHAPQAAIQQQTQALTPLQQSSERSSGGRCSVPFRGCSSSRGNVHGL